MIELKNAKCWIFDLDNTLYSGKSKVFEQVDKKMSAFISNKLNINLNEARKIQKNYFYEYNTTLNGLIKNNAIDPEEFLEFVHDVDISFLKKDLPLRKELEKMKELKIIFTNGSKKHALNVIKQLGIEDLFDGIFDIVDSKFIPKPSIEPYKNLIDKYNINPKLGILFEDIARNLKPAYDLGMKTVWIENNEAWASKDANENFVNFRTKNLSDFLKQVNMLKADQ